MTTDYERVPIEDIIKANEENFGHFFDDSAKRFFNSHWNNYGYKQNGFYFWITSEKFKDDPRKYTIRFACCECMHIREIGNFQQYDSLRQAENTLLKLLQQEIKPFIDTYKHWKMILTHTKCTNEQRL